MIMWIVCRIVMSSFVTVYNRQRGPNSTILKYLKSELSIEGRRERRRDGETEAEETEGGGRGDIEDASVDA